MMTLGNLVKAVESFDNGGPGTGLYIDKDGDRLPVRSVSTDGASVTLSCNGAEDKSKKIEDLGPLNLRILDTSEQTMAQIMVDNIKQGRLDTFLFDMCSSIAEEVAEDVRSTADIEEWNEIDVAISTRRVLSRKLGMEA